MNLLEDFSRRNFNVYTKSYVIKYVKNWHILINIPFNFLDDEIKDLQCVSYRSYLNIYHFGDKTGKFEDNEKLKNFDIGYHDQEQSLSVLKASNQTIIRC